MQTFKNTHTSAYTHILSKHSLKKIFIVTNTPNRLANIQTETEIFRWIGGGTLANLQNALLAERQKEAGILP